MDNTILQSINTYFDTLKVKGYMSDSSTDSLLLLIMLNELKNYEW
jgi:hypothetical protein